MYKDIYVFPAVITNMADDDYNVSFPDFEEIITYGETLEEAYIMAEDALKLCLFDLYQDKIDIPEATKINKIELKKDQVTILVKIELKKVVREYDNKAVKKTLTVPAWLNAEAEEAHLNFSHVLQEGLKKQLNISE
ncbi:type II toxin-antitoxin system HicB family antitoxin [Clostridium tyrobutyricum]|uniref:type II toxin-antitoxin system HicB family antitoxin n=1 Tax=Clostridium tyrobutyricum TaxID=1519 RepID=UPI002B20569E|nr:type II toxin-antitoxin system HicB family antitoxin [Clostridium tyrobutyricum]MEA5008250.1 type II toxin-antitoxin system HicB family antitoxin [Clostridium tyrobutyricum]